MPEINTGPLSQSLLVCEVGSLNLELKDSAERAGQQAPASCQSLALGFQMHEAAPECWGPELGFHACTVGSLPTEPSPRPPIFISFKTYQPEHSTKISEDNTHKGEKKKKGSEKSKFGDHFVNCLYILFL